MQTEKLGPFHLSPGVSRGNALVFFFAALLSIGLFWLNRTVREVASLYNSDFSLSLMPFADGLTLLAGAMLLGLVGAWLAVGRHIRAIEPQ